MAEIKKGMLIYKDVYGMLGNYSWQSLTMGKDGSIENGKDWYYWKDHKILISGPTSFPSKVGKVYYDVELTEAGKIPDEYLNDGESTTAAYIPGE